MPPTHAIKAPHAAWPLNSMAVPMPAMHEALAPLDVLVISNTRLTSMAILKTSGASCLSFPLSTPQSNRQNTWQNRSPFAANG